MPSARDDLWLAVLDVFWPLSMLGMFVIGVKIAFAGRWTGAARIWPLVAESWAVVSVPAFGKGDKRPRVFLQLFSDFDPRDVAADSIQTFFGIDVPLSELFR